MLTDTELESLAFKPKPPHFWNRWAEYIKEPLCQELREELREELRWHWSKKHNDKYLQYEYERFMKGELSNSGDDSDHCAYRRLEKLQKRNANHAIYGHIDALRRHVGSREHRDIVPFFWLLLRTFREGAA
ncbi:hypothetical protein DXG03_002265, partial [Asterophora parasitica]